MPSWTATSAVALALAVSPCLAQNNKDVSTGNYTFTPLPGTGANGIKAIYAAYTVLGGDDKGTWKAIARVVTEPGGVCPVVKTATDSLQMKQRGALTGTTAEVTTFQANFPVTVCEVDIPNTIGTGMTVSGVKLPDVQLNNPEDQVAFIGDTGCRPQSHQQCDNVGWSWDDKQFALKLNAEKIKQGNYNPVVHVGDYVYRDCSGAGKAICDTSTPNTPWGNNWATWARDFFEPMQDLLSHRPFLFNRGNHEICDRAGDGFFLFLDHTPYAETTKPYCLPRVKPYYVPAGMGLRVWAFDNTAADDGIEYVNDGSGNVLAMGETMEVQGMGSSGTCQSKSCKKLLDEANKASNTMVSAQIEETDTDIHHFKTEMANVQTQSIAVRKKDNVRFIFTSHRPLGAIMKMNESVSFPSGVDSSKIQKDEDGSYNFIIDYVNLKACPEVNNFNCFKDEAGISQFITGHMHTLQALVPTSGGSTVFAPRIVIGNGGVILNGAAKKPSATESLVGKVLATGVTVEKAWTGQSYGFAHLSKAGTCYETTLYRPVGPTGAPVPAFCPPRIDIASKAPLGCRTSVSALLALAALVAVRVFVA